MKFSADTHRPCNLLRSSGMTLIEVLVAVAIVAVLAGLAGPSFISTIQRFRSLNETSAFVGDLQFARTEAIKQGQPITLCASTDGTNCLTTSAWNTGWIIFSDPKADKTICGTCLLRIQKSWSGTDIFAASAGTSAVTFNRDGFRASPPLSTGTVTFTLHTIPLNSNATQCVTVSLTGRQSTLPYDGTTCT